MIPGFGDGSQIVRVRRGRPGRVGRGARVAVRRPRAVAFGPRSTIGEEAVEWLTAEPSRRVDCFAVDERASVASCARATVPAGWKLEDAAGTGRSSPAPDRSARPSARRHELRRRAPQMVGSGRGRRLRSSRPRPARPQPAEVDTGPMVAVATARGVGRHPDSSLSALEHPPFLGSSVLNAVPSGPGAAFPVVVSGGPGTLQGLSNGLPRTTLGRPQGHRGGRMSKLPADPVLAHYGEHEARVRAAAGPARKVTGTWFDLRAIGVAEHILARGDTAKVADHLRRPRRRGGGRPRAQATRASARSGSAAQTTQSHQPDGGAFGRGARP